jgi:hypothetical protein
MHHRDDLQMLDVCYDAAMCSGTSTSGHLSARRACTARNRIDQPPIHWSQVIFAQCWMTSPLAIQVITSTMRAADRHQP